MSNPFTGYNSNQRVIAIPPTPTAIRGFWNGVDVVLGDIFVSTANINAGSANAFIFGFYVYPRVVAGVTGAILQLSITVVDGGGAVLFGPFAPLIVSAMQNGTTGAYASANVAPAAPIVITPLPIGATAQRVRFSVTGFGALGAPGMDILLLAAVDPLNTGLAGAYGGSGMTNFNAGTNPNTF